MWWWGGFENLLIQRWINSQKKIASKFKNDRQTVENLHCQILK